MKRIVLSLCLAVSACISAPTFASEFNSEFRLSEMFRMSEQAEAARREAASDASLADERKRIPPPLDDCTGDQGEPYDCHEF